jgi:hypothetical protein
MHAHEVHAYETHAHKMHAYEMHELGDAEKFWIYSQVFLYLAVSVTLSTRQGCR